MALPVAGTLSDHLGGEDPRHAARAASANSVWALGGFYSSLGPRLTPLLTLAALVALATGHRPRA
ncbi:MULTISPECIES: hypothetical protein [Streptomyces violaceusniger group]|uniref:MFS transporter n=2 Tax=Streptomyces javensis TaxID=114698 RepID=A0ABP4I3G8_9ACTN|nr:hypothetical protein [Streptomyces javensis]MBI0312653.1 hypothetical protein [Streptomyces javensis]